MNKKQRIKQGQNLVNLIHPEMIGKERTDKVKTTQLGTLIRKMK
jgi:hypothetical protein